MLGANGGGCLVLGGLGLLVVGFFAATWVLFSPGGLLHDDPNAAAKDAAAPKGSDATFDGETKSKSAEPSAELTQKFASRSGLVVAHYPESFAASTPEEHGVLLQRNLDKHEGLVVIDAVPDPVSDQLEETDRVVRLASAAAHDGYRPIAETPGLCHGEPGIWSGGTYKVEGQLIGYQTRSCAFMKDGVYHRCSYTAPLHRFLAQEAVFKDICEHVEIKARRDQ